jgi:penicillin-binding protein A
MTAAGFDGQTSIGTFQVPLGRIIPPVLNKFETASLAIGLRHETVTPLHLAMIASMMANRGVLTNPRLLRQRRSILGDVVSGPAPQKSARLAPADVAEQMVAAMKAVVTSPRGTGRRAAIDGLSIAMKTGTAGARSSGLQAVILGFAPAEQPRIAFGMIAEDAGPAEFAGAKIARDFLESIRPRLH